MTPNPLTAGELLALDQLQSDTNRVQALQAHTQPEGETHE